jgi:hypothetical protein
MATLIGAALMLIAAFQICRAWRRPLAGSRNPVLGRMARALDQDLEPDGLPDEGTTETPAEVRERELSRDLVAGRIDPAAYQRAMSELARTTIEAGGPR